MERCGAVRIFTRITWRLAPSAAANKRSWTQSDHVTNAAQVLNENGTHRFTPLIVWLGTTV
jgi:hypothetical protein